MGWVEGKKEEKKYKLCITRGRCFHDYVYVCWGYCTETVAFRMNIAHQLNREGIFTWYFILTDSNHSWDYSADAWKVPKNVMSLTEWPQWTQSSSLCPPTHKQSAKHRIGIFTIIMNSIPAGYPNVLNSHVYGSFLNNR